MGESVRIGIVGVQHFHVFSFLETFSNRADVELVGVAEADPDRCARLRSECELPLFEDVRELIDGTHPDALALYNKASDRPAVICECARRGIHVWTDKPIATTLEDLERVEQALGESDVAFMMTVAGGYGARAHALKQMLHGGELGELVQFVALGSHRFRLPVDFNWERPAWAGDWRQAGGLIVEMGIHGINQFRWLADSPIVSISAEHGNRRFPELPHFHDHCAVLLRAADGAQGIIQSTWLTPDAEPSHGRNATFVFGTKGYVEAIGSGIAHGLQARGGRAHATITTDDAPPRPFKPDPGPGRSAAEDFLTQILTGRQPLVGKDFLLETVRAALLARDAAERHETIHVEPRH